VRVPPPHAIGGIPVPQDRISRATWTWACRTLPRYLLAHSVRSYCWAVELARREAWAFDGPVLWAAALFHDVGLTRIARNTMCFEVEGAELARAFLERHGMAPADADRAAIAIILHMQPNVGVADGVESVVLDQATGIDVRGVGIERIERVRDGVVRAFPRGGFDRLFLRAIEREVAVRGDCRSTALLRSAGLAAAQARSPWRTFAALEGRLAPG
jgi:hypothetical protein